jgi:ParB/RepB/Spo0J family partition protein
MKQARLPGGVAGFTKHHSLPTPPSDGSSSGESSQIKFADKQIVLIKVSLIDPSNIPARTVYTENMIRDMRLSIETEGQRDTVHVRINPTNPDRFMIMDGWTRCLSIKSIDADRVVEAINHGFVDDRVAARFGHLENKERNQPSSFDNAFFFKKLVDTVYASYPNKQEMLSTEYGVDPSTMSRYLAIADISDSILSEVKKYEPSSFNLRTSYFVAQAMKSLGDDVAIQFAKEIAEKGLLNRPGF